MRHCTVISLIVLTVAWNMYLVSTSENKSSWFGMGAGQCFGQTCRLGEYCSDVAMFRRCRSCEDVVVWCSKSRDYMRANMPSCDSFCEREEKRKMMAEFEAEKKTWLKVMDDTNNGSHSSLQREENISTDRTGQVQLDWLHYTLMGLVAVVAIPHVSLVLGRCGIRRWIENFRITKVNAGVTVPETLNSEETESLSLLAESDRSPSLHQNPAPLRLDPELDTSALHDSSNTDDKQESPGNRPRTSSSQNEVGPNEVVQPSAPLFVPEHDHPPIQVRDGMGPPCAHVSTATCVIAVNS